MMALELDHVRRRQVVRHQYGLLFGAGGTHAPGLPEQHFQNALDDLHHVGLALAQVRVLDGVELLDQHVHLLGQCPFGIAKLLGDHPLGRLPTRSDR